MLSDTANVILAYFALANTIEFEGNGPEQTVTELIGTLTEALELKSIFSSLAELENSRLLSSYLDKRSRYSELPSVRRYRITTEGAYFALSNSETLLSSISKLSPPSAKLLQQFDDLRSVLGLDSPEQKNTAQLPIPASDRYVGVGDNIEAFDKILSSLDTIKNEFKLDHNKGELSEDLKEFTLDDIAEFEMEVEHGHVKSSTAKSLLLSLEHLETASLRIAGLLGAITIAIAALKALFGF